MRSRSSYTPTDLKLVLNKERRPFWICQCAAGATVEGAASVPSQVDPVLTVCHPVRAIVVTTLLLLQATMDTAYHCPQVLIYTPATVKQDNALDTQAILTSSPEGANDSAIFDDVITGTLTATNVQSSTKYDVILGRPIR